MTTSDMYHTGKENQNLSEELRHISGQLDELIRLIRDSTAFRTENKPDVTIKEAAAMLRISLPKMYEFARTGKIHAIEIGRRILVSRSSIMALLMEGEESNGN